MPIRGANANNGVNAGVAAINLNNTASNANWNQGAALTYQGLEQKQNAPPDPYLSVKINPMQASASSISKADERIRH